MRTNILTEDQKVIARQILDHLKNEKTQSVLMHCHPSPDPDSLGSVLAAKYALESMGKKVTVIAGDSKIPEAFMHFPGAKEIIIQNYFQTDLTQFDTFLILDSGSPNMISRKLSSEDFPPKTNPDLKTIVIDHHATNIGYGSINLVALQYASTTEILFDVFQEWGIEISKEIAMNLYVGFFTDSGGFRYDRTTDHSFYMAGKLYESTPDIIEVVNTLENSASKGAIDFLGLALSQKKVYEGEKDDSVKHSGSFVVSYISFEDINRLGLVSDDWSGSPANVLLRSVIGWNVVALLIEETPGEVKVSLRSRDYRVFDVSKVASALGGGGHKAAAGARVREPIQKAIETVASAIRSELFNN